MNRTIVNAFMMGIHMYTNIRGLSAWPVLGAAIAVCTLFTGGVAAKDDAVTVSIQVSTQGLDVSQPRGAQKLYWRLQNAARVACTQGNRVGLAPSPDPKGCREKALAGAIRAAHLALLTQVYLASHTLWEATAYGIDVPVMGGYTYRTWAPPRRELAKFYDLIFRRVGSERGSIDAPFSVLVRTYR